MPQSLSCVILHIVFSTKNRQPFLAKKDRPKIFSYLSGIARTLTDHCYRVGGVEDHIHLATAFPRTITMADLISKLKTSSTLWIKKQYPHLKDFSWQQGYGAFSISYSHLPQLITYIDNQETHHTKQTFKEEYRTLLKKYQIPYDEKYVWD